MTVTDDEFVWRGLSDELAEKLGASAEELIGARQVVFIDRGSQDRVRVGNRLYAIRRGDGYEGTMGVPVGKNDQRYPARSIGELLGQLYVATYFKPQAKKRMQELVSNLQETYAERIKRLDWMSVETKGRALTKLNSFMKKIGYPDKWKDYSALTIVNNSYVQNILN